MIEAKRETNLSTEDNWVTILDVTDPVGDDTGPGTYLYPTHKQFEPYQGLFDIERFQVEAGNGLLRFLVTFGQITNPWKGPHGFSHPLIEVYIDHRPGGERRPYYPGANIVFSPKAPWDTLIKVTGWGLYLFHAEEERVPQPKPFSDGTVRVLADQKTVEITVPMGEWVDQEPIQDAAFYLLVGGQDGFGPDQFRIVKKELSEWYFGGGDGSGYEPQIIDLVTPPGRSQQKILGSYDPEMRVLAVIEPVRRPNPLRTGIIYAASALIGLLLWYGWRKRNHFYSRQP